MTSGEPPAVRDESAVAPSEGSASAVAPGEQSDEADGWSTAAWGRGPPTVVRGLHGVSFC